MQHKTTSTPLFYEMHNWRIWIAALRPRTLSISMVPVIVGSALCADRVDHFNWFLIFMLLGCSFFLQIGTNLVNDALDFKKGSDTEMRIGPLRATQSGLLSYKEVYGAGCLAFGTAFLCAIPLMLSGGWPLFLIVLLSMACGYLYTGGPYPLAYLGISDIFILVFFGWVSTCSAYYLQTGDLNMAPFLAGTQIGLLAMIPHAINNLRDCKTDAIANKRTMAVRFGVNFAKYQIFMLICLPFLLSFLWLLEDKTFAFALPFIAFPSLLNIFLSILKTEPSAAYNALLAKSALCQLLFGCLLAIGFLL